MKIEMEVGGISYRVEVDVDIDAECVIGIFGVEVFDGKDFHLIKMSQKELEGFEEMYQDNLNEAYEDYKESEREAYYDSVYEQMREEQVFGR